MSPEVPFISDFSRISFLWDFSWSAFRVFFWRSLWDLFRNFFWVFFSHASRMSLWDSTRIFFWDFSWKSFWNSSIRLLKMSCSSDWEIVIPPDILSGFFEKLLPKFLKNVLVASTQNVRQKILLKVPPESQAVLFEISQGVSCFFFRSFFWIFLQNPYGIPPDFFS